MPKISDPEAYFTATPDRFSGISRVVGVSKSERHAGVILESIGELEFALQTYNSGIVPESTVSWERLT